MNERVVVCGLPYNDAFFLSFPNRCAYPRFDLVIEPIAVTSNREHGNLIPLEVERVFRCKVGESLPEREDVRPDVGIVTKELDDRSRIVDVFVPLVLESYNREGTAGDGIGLIGKP